MSIVTRNVSPKAKEKTASVKVPRFTTPYWLKNYWNHLKQVLIIIGLGIGFLLPGVPLLWLLVRVTAVPLHPVHNGWWYALLDIVLSVFWYTGYYIVCNAYQHSQKRRYR